MTSSRSKRMSSEYFFEPQTKKISNDESEEYKNSIYEKTMQKLKEGAKLLDAAPKSKAATAPPPTPTSHLHSEVKRGLRQISLNNKCELESESKIINPKEYCALLPEMCSFCERLGCFTPLNQCTECAEYFCNNCSFSTFIAVEDNHVCKSCFQ